MLSYQHGYHAGNFADVFKHVILTRLLDYMTRKDKPLFYLETHAGRGRYDLKSPQALKTNEARDGIGSLWSQRKQLPKLFSPYLQAIEQLNTHNAVQYYPGSPDLAIQLLRAQDRLFLSERHPGEFEWLAQLPKRGKRVFYSEEDGMTNLSALIPPPEKRGLIFIDPSYELKTEYRTIPNALKSAYQRFSSGVYCLWYPIIDNKLHQQLLRNIQQVEATNSLRVEFSLTGLNHPGMTGCGLWIINPPYVLAEELKLILQALRTVFNPGVSSYLMDTVQAK